MPEADFTGQQQCAGLTDIFTSLASIRYTTVRRSVFLLNSRRSLYVVSLRTDARAPLTDRNMRRLFQMPEKRPTGTAAPRSRLAAFPAIAADPDCRPPATAECRTARLIDVERDCETAGRHSTSSVDHSYLCVSD